MGKVEKITIKLAMLFIGLSLLFPARVLAAERAKALLMSIYKTETVPI